MEEEQEDEVKEYSCFFLFYKLVLKTKKAHNLACSRQSDMLTFFHSPSLLIVIIITIII